MTDSFNKQVTKALEGRSFEEELRQRVIDAERLLQLHGDMHKPPYSVVITISAPSWASVLSVMAHALDSAMHGPDRFTSGGGGSGGVSFSMRHADQVFGKQLAVPAEMLKGWRDQLVAMHGCYPIAGPGESKETNTLMPILDQMTDILKAGGIS